MKRNNIFLILCAFLVPVFAAPEIKTLNVDSGFMHFRDGTTYGKIMYNLDLNTSDNNDNYDAVYSQFDSVFVKVEMFKGNDKVEFSRISGAVGHIHVLDNQDREIWFETHASLTEGEDLKVNITIDCEQTPLMKKTNEMIAAATVDQMATMFLGGDPANVNTNFFDRPGLATSKGTLPTYHNQDGPCGASFDFGTATTWLQCAALASTWDTSLAFKQGEGMGKEFRAYGADVALGPGMNSVIDPKCGRGMEYFGEDSYLSGKMGSSTSRGIQSAGVIACPKHLAVNNKETGRTYINAVVDERSLMELFLPQFEKAFIEGGALSTMGAYNKINDVYSSGNVNLFRDVLKNRWGFMGYSMTDWEAKVSNGEDARKYGCDMSLPTDAGGAYTLDAFKNMDRKYIENHARHIVYALGKVGLLDANYKRYGYQELRDGSTGDVGLRNGKIKSEAHKILVTEIGAKSLVLAKNTNKTLPIDPNGGKKIFLTGPYADMIRVGGGRHGWESSRTDPWAPITIKGGLDDFLSGKTTKTVSSAALADYVIVVVGNEFHGYIADAGDGGDPNNTGEDEDRKSRNIDEASKNAVSDALSSKKKVVVVYLGDTPSLPGDWSDKSDAVVLAICPGMRQGDAVASVLFGQTNPQGKCSVTWPSSDDYLNDFNAPGNVLNYAPVETAHGYYRANAMNKKPTYAFGHGLSYTTFEYSKLEIFPTTIKKGDRVFVSVNVKNTGSVKGAEVAQLYLSLPQGTDVKVRKQDLRGFNKVELNPGETKTVTFELVPRDYSYWYDSNTSVNDMAGEWRMLEGSYKVRVGTSSDIYDSPELPSVDGTFTVTK